MSTVSLLELEDRAGEECRGMQEDAAGRRAEAERGSSLQLGVAEPLGRILLAHSPTSGMSSHFLCLPAAGLSFVFLLPPSSLTSNPKKPPAQMILS